MKKESTKSSPDVIAGLKIESNKKAKKDNLAGKKVIQSDTKPGQANTLQQDKEITATKNYKYMATAPQSTDENSNSNLRSDEQDSEITPEELELLDAAGEDDEERKLHEAELDNKDEDGELLNEASSANDKTGGDLDVPGAEDDDENEAIGEEDEENDSYSLGADKKD